MADFQWGELHINWVLEKFKDETKELAAGDIERQFRSSIKRGEPRKGKPKGGEQTIGTQDFRNLMRLMVINKLARVTRGSFKSKNYRIRLVSDEYPFTQDFFSKDLLFHHPHMLEPMPDIEDVKSVWMPSLNTWTESHQQAFETNKIRGYMYAEAFVAYNYLGGDFDNIFLQFPEFDLESTDVADSKKIFILHVLFFISLYTAFTVGLPELQKWYKAIKDAPLSGNHDRFFTVAFSHILVQDIFKQVEKRDRKASRIYLSNTLNEILSYYKNGDSYGSVEIPRNLFNRVDKGFNPSEEVRHLISQGYAWFERCALRSSERSEVRKAVEDVDNAFLNILSFRQTRLNRCRNSKTSEKLI